MRIIVGFAGACALAALAAPSAEAQYGYGYSAYGQPARNIQCEKQRSNDTAAGTVVGALAGALIGGAIGNNIENEEYEPYYGRRGPPVYYRRDGSESAQVAIGAVLGAVVGGLAGNEIAKTTGPDCQVAVAPFGYASVPTGSIPRTTHGLYGGPETFGHSASGETYPHDRSYRYEGNARSPSPGYGSRDKGYDDDRLFGGRDYSGRPGSSPAGERECRTVYRETRLPDGRIERDPVTACRRDRFSDWRIQDGWPEYDSGQY